MSIIWIRHAEKSFDNGKGPIGSFQHDPGIIKDDLTNFEIKNLVNELIFENGYPDKIICSPFLRTRETMNLILEHLNRSVEIEYSTSIAEYLGFCKRDGVASLCNETRALFPFTVFLGESLNNFNRRVKSHIESVRDSKKNIWVITHGFVMCKIYEQFNNRNLKRPNPLSYIVLKNNILKSSYEC